MKTFPVIASIISPTQIGEFISNQYQLGDDFICTLYRTGVNHTYFLSNKNTKYAVRVYCHNWRTKLEIQEELQLLKLLNKHGLSISTPISDKNRDFIQEIHAPEGVRYAVLFIFAEGEKMRFMTGETCFAIGSLMAKIHNVTATKRIERVDYNTDLLMYQAYDKLNMFFSGDLDEMKYLKQISSQIENRFYQTDFSEDQKGVVHLDIWYDNLSVNKENEIIIFDFDNCGNGPFILDVGYFCKQLFFIEADKSIYEDKVDRFLNGYRKERNLSEKEISLIPAAGAAIFIFYLGVQAQRFDWSNIFLTENYLKMFVGRIKNWLDYYGET